MILDATSTPKLKKGTKAKFHKILEDANLHHGLSSICARLTLTAEDLAQMVFLQRMFTAMHGDGGVVITDEKGHEIARLFYKTKPIYFEKLAHRLAEAIQTFRNTPALRTLVKLRGTAEYDNLCTAWEEFARAVYGEHADGQIKTPDVKPAVKRA